MTRHALVATFAVAVSIPIVAAAQPPAEKAPAAGMARKLATNADQLGTIGYKPPPIEWMTTRVVTKLPPAAVYNSRVLIDGLNDRFTAIGNCLVLSAGSFSRLTGIHNSIVFVN